MTSPFENLTGFGKPLKAEPPDAKEFAGLCRFGRVRLKDAEFAGLSLEGAVLASDAFFPFRDGVDAAAAAGVRAIVQPGGSVRDDEVIAAANEHRIAMVFTGRRLFRH